MLALQRYTVSDTTTQSPRVCRLQHAEALGVRDGLGEAFFQLRLVLVVRQQENVEARVGRRQP